MSPDVPGISRVYETVLYGPSVSAMVSFYADVLGLRLVGEANGLAGAFRLPDGGMLLVFDPVAASDPGRRVPHGAADPGHAAFAVPAGDLDRWSDLLRSRGIEIELEVAWDEGGRSIYFRDPGGNSVELVEGEAWAP